MLCTSSGTPQAPARQLGNMACPPKASQLLPDPSRSGYAGGAGAVAPSGAKWPVNQPAARANGHKGWPYLRDGAPPEVIASLRRDADEVVCLHTPKMFAAIGQWYAEFTQTRDEDVALLKRAAGRSDGSGAAAGAADTARSAAPDPPAFEREITVTAGDVELPGHLAIPDRAAGTVIFAHGSGSSRRSPVAGGVDAGHRPARVAGPVVGHRLHVGLPDGGRVDPV